MRLLFASIHCYLDPSSVAALCTRELLELLAGRGMDCRVPTTGFLDPERETSLDEVLTLACAEGRDEKDRSHDRGWGGGNPACGVGPFEPTHSRAWSHGDLGTRSQNRPKVSLT